MVPNISLRIQNIIKSIDSIISPALDDKNQIAIEQAALAVQQLKLIDEQWDKAFRYESRNLRNLMALCRQILELASELGVERTELTSIQCHLDQFESSDIIDCASAEKVIIELGEKLDQLLDAMENYNEPVFHKKVTTLILAYSKEQACRLRTWFKGAKLDPDLDELPDISEIL